MTAAKPPYDDRLNLPQRVSLQAAVDGGGRGQARGSEANGA